MVESAVDWSFVGKVVNEKGSGPLAFFVAPTTAITAGLDPAADTVGLLEIADIAEPLEVRVAGTGVVGVGLPVAVLEAGREAPRFLPLSQETVEAGQTWESLFIGPKGLRTVVGGRVLGATGDTLAMTVDGKLGRDSVARGAPVVIAGRVAGVIVAALGGDRLRAVPSNAVVRALGDWLPADATSGETRQLSQGAERALAVARAIEGKFGERLTAAEAVLLGVLLHGRGFTGENFAKNLDRYLLFAASGDPIVEFARRRGVSMEELPREAPARGPVTNADHGGIVGRAYAIRRATSGDDRISVRNLVGALLIDAHDVLVAARADLDQVRQQFLADIAAHCPGDDLRAWRRELASVTAAREAAGSSRRVQVRAGYRPDDLGNQDELGITEDVNMLCDVLAARDAEPPMSVGLFGDWGTGKSFFMRQMEHRIHVLMRTAREAEKEGHTSAYCSNIVQIRFNAWSYMDANLWANLALGIFEQLASPPMEPGAERGLEQERQEQERIADERRRVLAELDTFRQLKAEVALDREVALTQKAEVEAELKGIAEERANQAAQLAEVRAVDFVVELAKDDQLTQVRTQAAQELGLSNVPVAELKALTDELKTLRGRARAVWRLLQERRATGPVALAGVFCAAVLVVGLVLMLGPGRVRLAGLASFLASVTTGLTAFVARVRPVLAKTAKALDFLEQGVRRADERQRQLLHEQTKAEVVLTEKVRELEARQAALARREAETAAKVAESEKALQELEQGRRLYRFLEERSATADYRQHLGIIALIRRDFERLTQLLRFDQPPSARSLPRIDRIVLYVDDLDRCPPARVVEVLQAVHLLLAFPIFVVVVGVDARWLLRSLANHYSEMLGPRRDRDGRDDPELAGWESTPQNYLEKIFQIPFALSPMQSSGFSQLVGSLIGPTTPGGTPPGHAVPTSAAQSHRTSQAVPEAGSAVAVERGDAFSPEQAVGAPAEATTAPPTTATPGIDPNPPSLEITQPELEFIRRLAPAIATPRLAKRLVNVYRLVRASQSEQVLAGYVEGHEYEAVLVLLAILVGFPSQAGRVYDALADPALSGPWSEFVAGFEPRPSGTSHSNRFDASMTEEEARRWSRLYRCVMDLHETVQLPDDIVHYRRWVDRLARFSFETGRVRTASGPGPAPS